MLLNTRIPAGRTRIAPTPSGFLHAGNAFNFLLTERLAKASGSKLLLRIDDLDAERRRPEYIEDIFDSLQWLGIQIDEGPSGPDDLQRNWSQELRIPNYQALAESLAQQGALYPCACSRSQLDAIEKNGAGHSCRAVRSGDLVAGPSWRLRIEPPSTVAVPALSGSGEDVDLAVLMPDPVLLQRDTARPAYQLASLADDVEMGITFIVRGTDLRPSTACQLHLANLLKLEAFGRVRFLHHPLLRGADGEKLSKSAGSSSLRATRASGLGPDPLIRAVDEYWEALQKALSA